MPIQVLMPALSPTMEKGNLAKWLKKEGETIKSGDVIAEIETDKATMEVEAVDEGKIGKIVVPEGTENVKVNAVERVRAEVAAKRWAGDLIAMGTNTDPYQRCEGKYRLTRGIVEVLGEARNPFSILTKSTLILRDLDVLAEAARRTRVQTAFSVGTVDDEVWRLSEPGTPHPRRRLEALARLREAGVPTGVLAAPILPEISDGPAQLKALARALVEAGIESATPIVLHLRPGVKQEYLGWLAEVRPDLLARYDQIYGRRSYAPKSIQAEITARFQAAFAAARHRV